MTAKLMARRVLQMNPVFADSVRTRAGHLWARYVELSAPCVFVHVPKTAGTSIARTIGMRGITHSTAEGWYGHIGDRRWRRRFRFTVVRHPIDRLVSTMIWQKALRSDFARRYDEAFACADESLSLEVNAALRRLLASDRFHHHASMSRRVLLFGALDFDLVIRFEELDRHLPTLEERLGFRRGVPRLKSIDENTKKSVVLDRDVFDRLCEKLADDFGLFGYEPTQTSYAVSA